MTRAAKDREGRVAGGSTLPGRARTLPAGSGSRRGGVDPRPAFGEGGQSALQRRSEEPAEDFVREEDPFFRELEAAAGDGEPASLRADGRGLREERPRRRAVRQFEGPL